MPYRIGGIANPRQDNRLHDCSLSSHKPVMTVTPVFPEVKHRCRSARPRSLAQATLGALPHPFRLAPTDTHCCTRLWLWALRCVMMSRTRAPTPYWRSWRATERRPLDCNLDSGPALVREPRDAGGNRQTVGGMQ